MPGSLPKVSDTNLCALTYLGCIAILWVSITRGPRRLHSRHDISKSATNTNEAVDVDVQNEQKAARGLNREADTPGAHCEPELGEALREIHESLVHFASTSHMSTFCTAAPDTPCWNTFTSTDWTSVDGTNVHTRFVQGVQYNPQTQSFLLLHQYPVKSLIWTHRVLEISLNGSLLWEWRLLDFMDCASGNWIPRGLFLVIDCFQATSLHWDMTEDIISLFVPSTQTVLMIDHKTSTGTTAPPTQDFCASNNSESASIVFGGCSPTTGYLWRIYSNAATATNGINEGQVKAQIRVFVQQPHMQHPLLLPQLVYQVTLSTTTATPYIFVIPYHVLNQYTNTYITIEVTTGTTVVAKVFERDDCVHCNVADTHTTTSNSYLPNNTPRTPKDPIICHKGGVCRGYVMPVYQAAFAGAVAFIQTTRARFGVALPVEIWHCGEDDLPRSFADKLQQLPGVIVKDFQARQNLSNEEARLYQGYVMKNIALVLSECDECILVDADNIPLSDFTAMFSSEGYKKSGTYFMKNVLAKSWNVDLRRRPQERPFWEWYSRSLDSMANNRVALPPTIEWLPWFVSKYRRVIFERLDPVEDWPHSNILYHRTLKTPLIDPAPLLTPTQDKQDDPVAHQSLRDGLSWMAHSSVLMTHPPNVYESESSFVMMHKLRQFRAIKYLWEMAFDKHIRSEVYKHMFGDMELFWLACELAGTLYYREPYAAGWCGEHVRGNFTCGSLCHYAPPELGDYLLYINSKPIQISSFLSRQRNLFITPKSTTRRREDHCGPGAVKMDENVLSHIKYYLVQVSQNAQLARSVPTNNAVAADWNKERWRKSRKKILVNH